ncbi:hypothetical protein AMS68_000267 [Peltaster fructicola]|uniref:Inositol-pentakisphosphate 2-kinase n=1 Tax=Peltaster fructicola TaxID=286661 RepID=A0A6H0XJQ3_9PEZI|nr:hypothetical protein AMS68_000267 [Peltaster fructicola]
MDSKASVFAYFIDQEPPLLSKTPQYPATLCKFEYLDEGGANIVYRLTVVNGGQTPSRLDRKLLRLRKNLRHCQPATEQLKAFNENFRDLFPKENLVEHELVKLDDGIVTALNELLRKRVRPSHRAQDFLCPDEQYGMIVTDMTAELGEILVELKPKWLLQSPNAPVEATRCRTCALRAQRVAKKIATATDEQQSCPLMLTSTSAEDRKKSAQQLTDDRRIAQYLAEDARPLLASLKQHQQRLDRHGVLSVKDVDGIVNLCRAMTLRDCTLYVRRSKGNIEARLGDLDLKQPEKLTSWRNAEKTLIDEGWYANTEASNLLKRENICFLSRWIQP